MKRPHLRNAGSVILAAQNPLDGQTGAAPAPPGPPPLLPPSAIRTAKFSAEKIFDRKKFRSKNFSVKRIFGRKFFRPNLFFGRKKNHKSDGSIASCNVLAWRHGRHATRCMTAGRHVRQPTVCMRASCTVMRFVDSCPDTDKLLAVKSAHF